MTRLHEVELQCPPYGAGYRLGADRRQMLASRPRCPRCQAVWALVPGRIASGEKTLEVRRWYPDLDLCEDLLIVENGRFLHREGDEGADGTAVAIVRVKAVRPFVQADMQAACASYFEEGWLAWELSDLRPVTHPVTVRAARGIYQVDFLLPDMIYPLK